MGGVQVAVAGDEVIGFASSIADQIDAADLPVPPRRGLPRGVPVLRLTRLGVAVEVHQRGIGKRLMRKTFEQALALREEHGCSGVVVDAKPEAVTYYEQYGFEPFEVETKAASTIQMFLPIGTIEAALD